MHKLDFHIPTKLNLKSFVIQDNSAYDESFNIKNGLLEVVPPGFHRPLVFRVKKGFQLVLNSHLLKLNVGGHDEYPDLIDGIYKIKYSVDPNKDVNVEYYYFRNTKLQNRFLSALAELVVNKNSYSNKDYLNKKKEFLWIAQMIKTSKYLAEDLLDVNNAVALYNEINSSLKKLSLIK